MNITVKLRKHHKWDFICHECPFQNEEHDSCNITTTFKEYVECYSITDDFPKDCPLKQGPIMVTLEESV